MGLPFGRAAGALISSGTEPADEIRRIDVEDRLSRLDIVGQAFSVSLDLFGVVAGTSGEGAQVSFRPVSWLGLDNITILRNLSRDQGSAVVLDSFPASALKPKCLTTFSDQDAQLKTSSFYYWLKAIPQNKTLAAVYTGPVSIGPTPAGGYSLIRVVMITASGTYSPTAGARALYVECVGGGGAGGGAGAVTANASGGAGGGGGAYSAVFLSGSIKTAYSVQVGAGGTGVAGGTGTNGAASTFDSPSVCTAQGGIGGASLAAGTSMTPVSSGITGGPSSGGVGDIKADGGDAIYGVRLSGTVLFPGLGGSSFFGGVTSVTGGGNNNQNGFNGKQYGGGGSGAENVGTNASIWSGGNGAQGIVRVSEFG